MRKQDHFYTALQLYFNEQGISGQPSIESILAGLPSIYKIGQHDILDLYKT